MQEANSTIHDFAVKFAEIRRECECAIAQVGAVQMRRSLDGDVNSIADTMKHVGGNLCSRFTNFLTEDGEKAWRDREGEFIDDFPAGEAGRVAALAVWRDGWSVLETTLASLTDDDLTTTSRRPSTFAESRTRSRARSPDRSRMWRTIKGRSR